MIYPVHSIFSKSGSDFFKSLYSILSLFFFFLLKLFENGKALLDGLLRYARKIDSAVVFNSHRHLARGIFAGRFRISKTAVSIHLCTHIYNLCYFNAAHLFFNTIYRGGNTACQIFNNHYLSAQ